jgi:guanine deaminase
MAARTAIRGPVLTYTGDPLKSGLEHTMVYESDATVVVANWAN